jgi:AP-3 complex subunit delta
LLLGFICCCAISRSTFQFFALPFSHSHSYPKEKPVVRVTLEPAATPPPAKTKKPKSRNGVEGLKEEKAKRKKTKQEKEDNAAPSKGVSLNDDLDFWLSASNGNEGKEKKVVTIGEMTIDENAMSDSKKTAKKKKEKKEKKEKKAKKEKREKKDIKDCDDQNNHLSEPMIAPVANAWKSLVDDKRLIMVLDFYQKYLSSLF